MIKTLPKGNSLSGFSEGLVVEEFQAGEALIGRPLKEWA
jgi:hypothetical protein